MADECRRRNQALVSFNDLNFAGKISSHRTNGHFPQPSVSLNRSVLASSLERTRVYHKITLNGREVLRKGGKERERKGKKDGCATVTAADGDED